ncbi:MAG TPA: dihydrofolate reductase family protein [Pedobacter sp.]|uniref:dihydrofolate reductase family protein n=1 Tax=Pedobacter sp. TaxID=1411316 RepID=UPI002C8A27D8|nr:dihydrofolate reductase family protein [Pedobacter sp.]HMI05215.1 dihydrofolate reductase family protein [Pedobacter sp.]
MRKIILLMHVSLDGFVAGPNGEMDWIRINDEMFDTVGQFTENADAALYGRKTYEMMDGYWPTAAEQPNASKHDIEHGQWYNKVEKIVVSNSMKDTRRANTRFIGGDVAAGIEQIKQQPGGTILMIGSPSAFHELAAHNLVDEYWLFVNPLLIGSGIPIFKNISSKVELKLTETKTFSLGVIGLHYEKV